MGLAPGCSSRGGCRLQTCPSTSGHVKAALTLLPAKETGTGTRQSLVPDPSVPPRELAGGSGCPLWDALAVRPFLFSLLDEDGERSQQRQGWGAAA